MLLENCTYRTNTANFDSFSLLCVGHATISMPERIVRPLRVFVCMCASPQSIVVIRKAVNGHAMRMRRFDVM